MLNNVQSKKGIYMSALITVVIVLIVIGVILWLINTYIPMARPIKTILNVVVIICVILWLLSVFGVIHLGSISNLGNLRI